MTVNAGDHAPDYSMPGDTGPISATDLTGKIVVLYFYPKDDTSGCTNEAKGFTESAAEFDAIGAVVIGASKDTVASHAKFRSKYGLTPLLGSDAVAQLAFDPATGQLTAAAAPLALPPGCGPRPGPHARSIPCARHCWRSRSPRPVPANP
jgi:peroxiredoxin